METSSLETHFLFYMKSDRAFRLTDMFKTPLTLFVPLNTFMCHFYSPFIKLLIESLIEVLHFNCDCKENLFNKSSDLFQSMKYKCYRQEVFDKNQNKKYCQN